MFTLAFQWRLLDHDRSGISDIEADDFVCKNDNSYHRRTTEFCIDVTIKELGIGFEELCLDNVFDFLESG